MKRLVFGIMLFVLLAGCTSQNVQQMEEDNSAAESGNAQVLIQNFAYSPNTLTVNIGTTVTWTNLDSVVHTVTSDDFDSGNIAKDATFSMTFNDAGTYEYICTYHPYMSGTIIVS